MDILSALKKSVSSVREWVDENKVQKVSGKGLSTNDYTTIEKNKVAAMPNDLVILDGKLFLAQDGTPIDDSAVTLPSGGGGGGGSATVTLKNLLDSSTITTAVNGKAILKFSFASSETEDDGICYIYVGGNLKGTVKIVSGQNEIDVGHYVGEGTNEIKITCSDIYSNSKSLSYVVNAISLRITSTFDDSQIYQSDVNVRYIPYGAIEKTIHFVVDGMDNTTIVSETGKQQTYTIPTMSHGSHMLKLYATAIINDVEITSNILLFDIMCVSGTGTTAMISSAYDVTAITQGELVNIGFSVYDPVNMTTEVELIIQQNGIVYSSTTRTVDRTRQFWSVRDYPVGEVTFTIRYGAISKSHIINVTKSSVNISTKDTDLELQLKAAGRSNSDNNREVWASGDVATTFENFNWDSTGWVQDENGDVALRCSGDSRATINFMPFKSDARQTGRTIEMEFAIRDVNNRNAVAISCYSDGIGFTVTADTAKLMSEQSEISCNYTDEEKVHVAFVIEPRTEYRLMSVYLNGVLSGAKQYPENDNMQQTTTTNITVGSPYCSVDLYLIRSYNTALTEAEARDNYIADITDVGEKLSVIAENDIYDIYGNLSFSKLKDMLPILVITGDLPKAKGDKKNVLTTFTHPLYPQLNFEDTGKIDVQGTSSQWYIRKNYKIKYKQEHQHAVDQLPSNVFTWKADYAESTSTHNTGSANYVHTLYGDVKSPPQETNNKIRTTVYGYPALIFHKADSVSEPEFIGKYNANFDKNSLNVYGFTEDYPLVESWEFLNNTSDACLFHGQIQDNWTEDFEARYPDEYDDISAFKVMHDWVVSTWQDGATGSALGVTYAGTDGKTYTTDTAEYRLAKFKKEFTEHFDFGFSLLYYVYTFVMLMVDQRAKNMFLTSWDKVHYQPWFYDNDTILGINNEGVLVFDPFCEDTDKLGTANVFNGATSTLWTNFREAFPNEIKELYQELRSSGKLSYDKIIEYFVIRQSDKWCISIYNEDSDYKYISMLRSDNDATNLYQIRGTGEEHLKYFVKNRLMYCDSKWYGADYADDYMSLRIYTPSGDLAVPANANITVTPFSDIYAGVMYRANGILRQQRAKANTPITFIAPSETFNDTETAVYGASEMSSIGDLSPLYCGTVNVSKASKLTELIIGSGVSGYSNPNLRELAVGSNKLLKKIDIRNCPNYTSSLQISNCPNIQEIYATGSGITGLELPESGYLKKVHLPGTLTNLTITNQQYIQEFTLEGYDNLTTLRIEDAVNIPVEDIMLHAPNLNRIRLLDVSWEAESEAALKQTIEKFKSCLGLDASGNNTDKAVVTGRVKISSVSDKLYNDIYENFPDLIVDDNSGTPYIINFLDRNGNSLYVTRVAEGANAVDPIAAGLIERPSDIVTDEYTYEFVGWSTLPQNVHQHYKITPIYKIKYTINYYNGDNLVYQYGAYQGDLVIDPVSTGKIETPTKTGTSDITYKFSKWDNLPINVQSSVNIYAQYDTYWAVRFWNDNALYLTEWIIDGGTVVDPKQYFEDYTDPIRESTAQYDYHFSSWGGDFTTPITAVREFHAEYTSTIRRYNVYFYNGNELIYTVENVQYGSSTSYSGATPVKMGVSNPEDYVFKGWIPAPENITGETECYAFFKYTGYLFGKLGDSSQYGTVDNPNWDKINAYWTNIGNDVSALSNGTLATDDFNAKYQIGGRMIIPIELSDGTSTVADVEIIAHNHDNLADNSGKATLTFFCKDLPQILQRMNVSTGSVSGYKDSSMREFANGELLDALPNELKSIIKPVLKISDDGSQNKKLITTTDSCWLASYDEVGFINGSSNLSGQGELYSDVFSDDKDSREKYIVDNTDTGGWWLRSSVYFTNSNSTMFWRVQKTGAAYTEIQTNQFYVAFGFCI